MYRRDSSCGIISQMFFFFFSFFPPGGFWWKNYILDERKSFQLSFFGSVYYTIPWIFELSLQLSSQLPPPQLYQIQPRLNLCYLAIILRESSKSLKHHTSGEVHHIHICSHPLKKKNTGMRYYTYRLPPSTLCCMSHVVLSALIWCLRGEVRPYGDEAMLIMWHHIWSVWSVCDQCG